MTLWGVEFDQEGWISHIYYCENNNSDQDANGAVIHRYKVVYSTDPSMPETPDRIYTFIQPLDNEEGIQMKKYKVIVVNSIDLRQDIWQQKYPDIQPE